MKRGLLISVALLVASSGAVFAIGALEQAVTARPELPSLLPEGALLSIEARDFGALLHDWNSSDEKRAWLQSDNHAAFSTSRLFTRLSQAQDEFTAAAGLPADEDMLNRIAGKESCIALYDIGNLEFVYVTRLDDQAIQDSPLWQARSKFEQRTEAGSAFFVRKDEQSSRVAAFAARDGWLILGTREDLVAGVLDRIAGTAKQNLANEGWFVEVQQQTTGERGDLRMVLNLEKIVNTPYFRSYWVQQNITEMKQYASAVSDLYRSGQSYREERVLLRREGFSATAQGDVRGLAILAPENAAFYSAQASPDVEKLIASLRGNLLTIEQAQQASTYTTAPFVAAEDNAGSADKLDTMISQAPVSFHQTDAFALLRNLLIAEQPDASLEVFSTRPSKDGVFVSLQTAMVVSAQRVWDEEEVRRALSQALPQSLTAGKFGIGWEKHAGAAGEYLALDGAVPFYIALNGKQLLLANDTSLMEEMLARKHQVNSFDGENGITYMAYFHHTQEQSNFKKMMAQLDLAGHRGTENQTQSSGGETPAFFSGNVESFSQAFSKLESERIEERDRGAILTQEVSYQWTR